MNNHGTTYYTLLVRESGRWVPAFGDYLRAVVVEEQEDSYSECQARLIATDDNQAAIDRAVGSLNQGDNA